MIKIVPVNAPDRLSAETALTHALAHEPLTAGKGWQVVAVSEPLTRRPDDRVALTVKTHRILSTFNVTIQREV